MSATPSWKPSVLEHIRIECAGQRQCCASVTGFSPAFKQSSAEERSPDLMKPSSGSFHAVQVRPE
jgi:hypothetical protein